MPHFDIDVTQTRKAAVVRLIGELDLDTAPRLRDEINSLVRRGVCAITLDLADLNFIDSTGLSVLVVGLKRVREHGGELALRSPKPSTLRVFEITGLTRVFAIS